MNYLISIPLAIISLFLFYQTPAYAYLDPGTGRYNLHIVIALLLTALYVVKIYWLSIKQFITSFFKKSKKDGEDQ